MEIQRNSKLSPHVTARAHMYETPMSLCFAPPCGGLRSSGGLEDLGASLSLFRAFGAVFPISITTRFGFSSAGAI